MAASAKVRQVQELRRSNAARPIPSGKQYQRRRKHKVQWSCRTEGKEAQT